MIVSSVVLVSAGAIAEHEGNLSLCAPDHPPRLLAEGVTAWCLSPVDGGLVFASGDDGVVRHVPISGVGERRVWAPIAAKISTIAASTDGRVAVGTEDEKAHLGEADGTWSRTVAMPEVPDGWCDVWSCRTIGVGFFPDGTWVAIAGTGLVHVFDRDGDAHTFDAEILAWDGYVEIAPLAHDRLILASGRACVIASRTEVVSQHRGVRGSSGDHRAFFDETHVTVLATDGSVHTQMPKPLGTCAIERHDDVIVTATTDGALVFHAEDGTELDARGGGARAIAIVRSDDAHLVTVDFTGALQIGSQHAPRGARREWPAVAPTRAFSLDVKSYAAEWSNDGRSFAVRTDGFSVHRAADGQRIGAIAAPDAMDAFPIDDHWLLYFRHRVGVFDGATLAPISETKVPSYNMSLVARGPTGFVLSGPGGLVVATASGARVIDTGVSSVGDRLEKWLYAASASPNGRRIAVIRQNAGAGLIAIDGSWIADLDAPKASWMFSSDGAWLLDADTGAIFDGVTGARVATCGDGTGKATWVSDELIAWCGAKDAFLCTKAGKAIAPLRGAEGGRPVRCPNGNVLVHALQSCRFYDSNAASIGDELRLPVAMRHRFFRDDRLVLWPSLSPPPDPTMIVVDLRTGAAIAELHAPIEDSLHGSCPVGFGDDVLVASRTQAPWAFALDDGAPRGRLGTLERVLRTIAVSPATGELLLLEEHGRVSVFSALR